MENPKIIENFDKETETWLGRIGDKELIDLWRLGTPLARAMVLLHMLLDPKYQKSEIQATIK